jgi:hypothetical protein
VRNQHRLGALQMRVAGHDGLARCMCVVDEGARPRSQAFNHLLNLGANIEPQIGRDLFIAAAPGVQLESQRTDPLHHRQLDVMVDVFGGRMIAHRRFPRVRRVVRSNRVQRRPQLRCFTHSQNSGCAKGGRVRLAGGYLFREEPPVENNRSLPLFEVPVERLPKAARPHLHGLVLVGH